MAFLTQNMTKDTVYQILNLLYEDALTAMKEDEIPVSALLYFSDKECYISHNQVEKENNPFSHAEFNVIQKAMKEKKTKYLSDGKLFVTLEPCLFCLGAILKANIPDLYYVMPDKEKGSLSHFHAFVDDALSVHEIEDKRFENLFYSYFKKMREKSSMVQC